MRTCRSSTKRMEMILVMLTLACFGATTADGVRFSSVYEGPTTLLDGYMDTAEYYIDAFTKPANRTLLTGSVEFIENSLRKDKPGKNIDQILVVIFCVSFKRFWMHKYVYIYRKCTVYMYKHLYCMYS